MSSIPVLVVFIHGILRNRAELTGENLALRQQQAVLTERKIPPGLRRGDRIFCEWLSRLWAGRRSVLVIVHPDTVAR